MLGSLKLPIYHDEPSESIKDEDGRIICSFGPSDFSWTRDAIHAAEIVAACNGREALVKACRKVIDAFESDLEGANWVEALEHATGKCRAALAPPST